jgi:hypothetical protein
VLTIKGGHGIVVVAAGVNRGIQPGVPLVVGVSFRGNHVAKGLAGNGSAGVAQANLDATVTSSYEELVAHHHSSRSMVD